MAQVETVRADVNTLDLSEGMINLNDAEAGWEDMLSTLKAEAARLPPCTIAMHPRVRAEDAIASAEAFDRKTDALVHDAVPLRELVGRGTIRKAVDLSESDVLATADCLLSFFALHSQGRNHALSLNLCAYVHDMTLAAGHPLELFVRSLLQAALLVGSLIDQGGIRDGEEEFTQSFPVSAVGLAISKDLDIDMAALAKQVAAGTPLAKRFQLLEAICGFALASNHVIRDGGMACLGEIKTAVGNLRAATAAAGSLHSEEEDELVAPTTTYSGTGAMWDGMAVLGDTDAVEPAPWSKTVEYFARVAEDCAVPIDSWVQLQPDLFAVLEAVKAFAFLPTAPTLVGRSFAAVFVMHGHKLFGGETQLVSMLEMLRDRFGAPWYAAILRPRSVDDESISKKCMAFTTAKQAELRNQQPQNNANGATSKQLDEELARQLRMSVSQTLADIGRMISHLLLVYLRNLGRCHRALVNTLPHIAQLQRPAYHVDHVSFLGTTAVPAKPLAAAIARNEVLQAVVSDLLHDTCMAICVLTQKLNLLTDPEVLPLQLYYQILNAGRAETTAVLYPSPSAIVEMRDASSRRTSPVLALRERRAVPALHTHFELQIMMTRTTALALELHEELIPQLKMGPLALQTPANVFNHRFRPLMESFPRGALIPYADLRKTVVVANKQRAVSQIVDNFKVIASRATQAAEELQEAGSCTEGKTMLLAMAKAAKKNAVIVGIVASVPGYTVSFSTDADHPFLVSLTAVKGTA